MAVTVIGLGLVGSVLCRASYSAMAKAHCSKPSLAQVTEGDTALSMAKYACVSYGVYVAVTELKMSEMQFNAQCATQPCQPCGACTKKLTTLPATAARKHHAARTNTPKQLHCT